MCGSFNDSTDDVCSKCAAEKLKIAGEFCFYCGKEKCNRKHRKGFVDGFTAPYRYESGMQKCIRRLKFGNKVYIADFLTDEMVKSVKEKYCNINFDFITYVPFSERQKKARKNNISKIFAEKLSQRLNLKVENAIVKIYDNETQHNTRKSQRRGNVLGVYDINSQVNVSEKVILLVDDIKTSGATLDECAKMLKIHGAESVYCTTAVFK